MGHSYRFPLQSTNWRPRHYTARQNTTHTPNITTQHGQGKGVEWIGEGVEGGLKGSAQGVNLQFPRHGAVITG